MPDRIYVAGLKELSRALRATGNPDDKAELKQAGRTVADKVVSDAKGRASGRLETKAAGTLRAAAIGAGAGVRFGGGFAGSFGAEFGAGQNVLRNTHRGTMRGWNMFQPWRGSGDGAGYFLWPTIRDDMDEILDIYGKAIEDVFDRNWLYL